MFLFFPHLPLWPVCNLYQSASICLAALCVGNTTLVSLKRRKNKYLLEPKKEKKHQARATKTHSQKAKGHIFNTSYNNPDDIMSKMFKTNRGKEGGGWLCNIYPSAVCSLQCWKERRTPHGVNMSPKIHPSILHSVYPPSSWHSCDQMAKLSLGICPQKVQLHPRVGAKRRGGSGTNPYFFF